MQRVVSNSKVPCLFFFFLTNKKLLIIIKRRREKLEVWERGIKNVMEDWMVMKVEGEKETTMKTSVDFLGKTYWLGKIYTGQCDRVDINILDQFKK